METQDTVTKNIESMQKEKLFQSKCKELSNMQQKRKKQISRSAGRVTAHLCIGGSNLSNQQGQLPS